MKKIFLILLLFSSHTFADTISEIVFFGDSLSDNGNFYRETRSIMPKSPPYYYGRFTNGPTWSELMGNYFKKIRPTLIENYAVAGAMVVPHNLTSYVHSILRTEIKNYLLENQKDLKEQTLYVIWIGGNDYIDMKSPCNVGLETASVVANIQSALESLADYGAKHFLIFNLPDLSKTPLSSSKPNADREVLSQLIHTHNNKLLAATERFKTTHPNIQVIYHDIYADFENLFNNPEVFSEQYNQHITDARTSCWTHGYLLNAAPNQPPIPFTYLTQSPNPAEVQDLLNSADTSEAFDISNLFEFFHETPCTTPNTHAFWDKLHPSAATHQIIAQIAEKALADENIK